ncbi:hypothetical protein LCGC14_1967840 [marine sediment metagenome]|uniref:Uncharacterized protein n=1 Tax=marine sediment metagenome TaxID=412755 RepID=A0A0F9I9L5_9ZZZZ
MKNNISCVGRATSCTPYLLVQFCTVGARGCSAHEVRDHFAVKTAALEDQHPSEHWTQSPAEDPQPEPDVQWGQVTLAAMLLPWLQHGCRNPFSLLQRGQRRPLTMPPGAQTTDLQPREPARKSSLRKVACSLLVPVTDSVAPWRRLEVPGRVSVCNTGRRPSPANRPRSRQAPPAAPARPGHGQERRPRSSTAARTAPPSDAIPARSC